jgi:hypothetical protein
MGFTENIHFVDANKESDAAAKRLRNIVSDRSKLIKFHPSILEQDRFGWNHLASTATFRPKRESCSIQYVESKIHVP